MADTGGSPHRTWSSTGPWGELAETSREIINLNMMGVSLGHQDLMDYRDSVSSAVG
jgi:hypothetical protein